MGGAIQNGIDARHHFPVEMAVTADDRIDRERFAQQAAPGLQQPCHMGRADGVGIDEPRLDHRAHEVGHPLIGIVAHHVVEDAAQIVGGAQDAPRAFGLDHVGQAETAVESFEIACDQSLSGSEQQLIGDFFCGAILRHGQESILSFENKLQRFSGQIQTTDSFRLNVVKQTVS